jgi:aspartate 1-decarboxylase
MYIKMLRSKIHRATVTGTDLNYVGSITIDEDLLLKTNIKEYQYVEVVNINNGSRLETYVIKGEKNSGAIELNGAAARLAQPGDKIIILAHVYLEEPIPDDLQPTIILLNEDNQLEEVLC